MTGRGSGGKWGRAALATAIAFSSPSPLRADPSTPGAGLPTESWPAGTLLSSMDDTGQITTLHRGVLHMGGKGSSLYYDISDPENPVKLKEVPGGADGHLWWKIGGDFFFRTPGVPEASASGHRFLDLSDPLNAVPWTSPFPVARVRTDTFLSDVQTFPHAYDSSSKSLWDVRTAQKVADYNFEAQKGNNTDLKLRIGNLWFYVGREGFGDGLSVFDVGDPANPRLLDALIGNFRQYTYFYGVWRNLICFMHGDNTNGANNLVAVDYSDPTDLKVAFRLPTQAVTASRYINFQDEYAFTSRFGKAVKLNMETRAVEREFPAPDGRFFPDFQAVPLGHLLLITGSEGGVAGTYIYAHQDGRDARRPTLGHHVPADGAVNQPVGTVVGLVINETLDDTTLSDQTIQIRPAAGGPVVPADVVSGQHNVVNVVPRQPLTPDTEYEVTLVQDGIRDVAGNGVAETRFRFTTGAGSDRPPAVTALAIAPASPVPQRASVTFTATASDPEGGALQYKWDFGDGAAPLDWGAAGTTAAHVYATAGSYVAQVQARDAGGNVTGKSMTLTVSAGVDASVAAQDRRSRGRSSQIAMDGGRAWAWVSNPDADTVTAMDTGSMTVVREIPTGRRPMGITFDGAGRGWVACRDSDEVRVLNWNGTTAATIPLPRGSRPVSVVMNPPGTVAYVAEYATGRVRRFDTTTFAETGSINVGPTLQAMAVSEDGGRLLVSRFISPDAGGEVRSVDLLSFALEAPVSLPVDSATADTAATGRGVPNYVGGIALEPGITGRGWYAAKKDNILKGIVRDGTPLGHDSSVRALVGTFDPFSKVEDVSRRIDIDNNTQPSAIAVDPYGALVLVGLMGNNRLVVLDARTGQEVVRADVGLAPQGIAVDPVSNRIWVQDFMGRTVTVLDGNGLIQRGERSLPRLATINTVGNETLPPQVLQGKRVFYNAEDPRMSLEGYVNCAVCHLDGGHDGRTWDFTDRGEGLRNTIPLRGRGGMAQGKVHWSANFDEVQDFEHDIRGPFAGTGFLTDGQFNQGTRNTPLGDAKAGLSADLDALAAYVASLTETAPSPFKNPDGTLTVEAQAGKRIYERQNCASCHEGPAFTDSAKGVLHDVGTLTAASGRRLGGPLPGLDTPTLKGLWDTAPYLHDGSAATLMDVLNHPRGAEHGGMDQLTAQEKTDLAAYLLQLDDGEGTPPGPTSSGAGPGLERTERLLTPGSDGNNDAVDFGAGAEAVTVFNTRGRVVFEREGTSLSWDGRIEGKPAPSGLYVARVRGRDGSFAHRKILIVR